MSAKWQTVESEGKREGRWWHEMKWGAMNESIHGRGEGVVVYRERELYVQYLRRRGSDWWSWITVNAKDEDDGERREEMRRRK